MLRAIIVVRELGRRTPDYSLHFDLPALPRAGDYISIYRPDRKHHTEDVVVRHVWWLLDHPETGGFAESGRERVGKVREIVVECDQALGPTANDQWRLMMNAAKERGVDVVDFDVERLSVTEAQLVGK